MTKIKDGKVHTAPRTDPDPLNDRGTHPPLSNDVADSSRK
jgi:hypothetical protein